MAKKKNKSKTETTKTEPKPTELKKVEAAPADELVTDAVAEDTVEDDVDETVEDETPEAPVETVAAPLSGADLFEKTKAPEAMPPVPPVSVATPTEEQTEKVVTNEVLKEHLTLFEIHTALSVSDFRLFSGTKSTAVFTLRNYVSAGWLETIWKDGRNMYKLTEAGRKIILA